MSDIKKFARGFVIHILIPILIGSATGIFVAIVIKPAFDLGLLETAVTVVAVASGVYAIFLFITRKKK